VSKALFYVYFARKEDVLLELEMFTVRDAKAAAHDAATGPYELVDVIAAVVATLECQTRAYPSELIFEAVLETYRLEGQALAAGATTSDLASLFLAPFQRAQRDGVIPDYVAIDRAALISQTLVADGIRCWAANGCSGPLSETLSPEIAALVGGLWSRPRSKTG
jgi:AcrR family transcriptional regulator